MSELHLDRGGVEAPSVSASDAASTIFAELIGERRSIASIGVADLALARVLSNLGCQARVSLDVADVDAAPLASLIGRATVDCIVFYNALEALRQPARVLDEARAVLGERGCVIAVTSNGSHGAIRLARLDGRAREPEMEGRFDARGLDVLLLNAGYRIDRFERIRQAFGSHSPALPDVPEGVSADARSRIARDPDFETLQFVFRALPLSDQARNRTLARRLEAANQEIVQTHSHIDDLTRYAKEVEGELGRANLARAATDKRLKAARRRAEAAKNEADAARRLRVEIAAIAAAGNALLHAYATAEERIGALADTVEDRESAVRDLTERGIELERRGEQTNATVARQRGELDAARVDLKRLEGAASLRASWLEAKVRDGRDMIDRLDTLLDATRRSAALAYEELEARFAYHVAEEARLARSLRAAFQRDVHAIQSTPMWRFKRFLARILGAHLPDEEHVVDLACDAVEVDT